MIANVGSSLYRINLIRDLREKEMKSEKRRRLTGILSLGCFGFFLLSLMYSTLTIWQMERVLKFEEEKLVRLNQEYQKYKSSRLIVDKKDVELLSGLQGRGVFWTKKLAAMAKHLPENYWITRFAYQNGKFIVSGFGYASNQQNQLLILDKYLNDLRKDPDFTDIFNVVQLEFAERKQETGHVAFQFAAKAARSRN
ncbi:MAG: PilN domain-containing protein [Fibrobacterota bacterium]|nr:PilN domain-containing protein [Fibrobacterota bacterium]